MKNKHLSPTLETALGHDIEFIAIESGVNTQEQRVNATSENPGRELIIDLLKEVRRTLRQERRRIRAARLKKAFDGLGRELPVRPLEA